VLSTFAACFLTYSATLARTTVFTL